MQNNTKDIGRTVSKKILLEILPCKTAGAVGFVVAYAEKKSEKYKKYAYGFILFRFQKTLK